MKAYEDPFVDLGSHSERVIEKMDVFLRDVFLNVMSMTREFGLFLSSWPFLDQRR